MLDQRKAESIWQAKREPARTLTHAIHMIFRVYVASDEKREDSHERSWCDTSVGGSWTGENAWLTRIFLDLSAELTKEKVLKSSHRKSKPLQKGWN